MIKFKIPYEYGCIRSVLYSEGTLDWDKAKYERWRELYNSTKLTDNELDELCEINDEFYNKGEYVLDPDNFEVEDNGQLLIDDTNVVYIPDEFSIKDINDYVVFRYNLNEIDLEYCTHVFQFLKQSAPNKTIFAIPSGWDIMEDCSLESLTYFRDQLNNIINRKENKNESKVNK